MRIHITPSTARGRIPAPPSKSMAHRALICGALSGGSEIRSLAWSEDIKATLRCLAALGAQVTVNGDTVHIGGLTPAAATLTTPLDCHESGSTLRFLIPLSLLSAQPITLIGAPRLMARPLGVYEALCREAGLTFQKDACSLTVCGPLAGGMYSVPADVSSQFISGLLFALPLVRGDSEIRLTGHAESLSYIDLTLKALRDFGITVEHPSQDRLVIAGSQTYQPRIYTVEGDYSNTAFLEAFNLFGGDVTVDGLDSASLQGDRVYRTLFPRLAAGDTSPIDLTDCPDLAPILFAVAAAKGGGTFVGTARLKLKESDRAATMQAELAKCGIPVTAEENRVIIHPATLTPPATPIDGHNDHRIVMAMSVLLSIVGGDIIGAEAVTKSYPAFFDDINNLGIQAVILCD